MKKISTSLSSAQGCMLTFSAPSTGATEADSYVAQGQRVVAHTKNNHNHYRTQLMQFIKLILVQGPHTAQVDLKWARLVKLKHNLLISLVINRIIG